jgi:hypothetical protein
LGFSNNFLLQANAILEIVAIVLKATLESTFFNAAVEVTAADVSSADDSSCHDAFSSSTQLAKTTLFK